MPKTPLPDSFWHSVASAAGALPDEARHDVTNAIQAYGDVGVRHFIRTNVRNDVSEAIKKACELSAILGELEQNREFQEFHIAREATKQSNFVEEQKLLSGLCEKLERDSDRLNERSSRKWQVVEASALVTRLLEIRTDYLNVDVPTTALDTTKAGPFLDYVKLCIRYADPKLTETQIADAIDAALIGFQQRRPFEPENFPSVQQSIVKKNL